MTNLSDRGQLKEVVKRLEDSKRWSKDGWASIWVADVDILIALAQFYLTSASELPEEKEHKSYCDSRFNSNEEKHCNCGAIHFNSALRLCRLASVKDKMRVEELSKQYKEVFHKAMVNGQTLIEVQALLESVDKKLEVSIEQASQLQSSLVGKETRVKELKEALRKIAQETNNHGQALEIAHSALANVKQGREG